MIIGVNNGRTMLISQRVINGSISVEIADTGKPADENLLIPPEDFVMLVNFYKYIKLNDIQNDFINPHGKNKEE